MPIHLLIAPPAAGKTQFCLEQMQRAFQADPFASVWMLVPDQLQAEQARLRLAAAGPVLPVRVATFKDLNVEILELAGRSLPEAKDAMLHRMLQEELRRLCQAGELPYYSSICDKPGLLIEVHERIRELKEALVMPERLAEAARRRGDPGLAELARLYGIYQTRLQELGWADTEGLAWLAYDALAADPDLMAQTAVLVVDGFDDFNPTQLRTLRALASRTAETWITLPGDSERQRAAHRRFQRAAQNLQAGLPVEVHTLPGPPRLPPTLGALEVGLFEAGIDPSPAQSDLEWIEARSPAEESREALRWLKGRILRDGVPLAACAIAVPELETYRQPLSAAAAEFGLPLAFSHGAALAGTPAAAAVSDLLGLALNDYPRRLLLDTIRSPYFNLRFTRLERKDARLLELASQYGQVVQGLGQWEDTLAELSALILAPEAAEAADEGEPAVPRLPSGEVAERLLAGLHALADRLSPPGDQRSLLDWTAWLEELLEALGFYDCLLEADETILCRTFEDLLSTLGRSEALTGPCPADFAGFLKTWDGLLAATAVKSEYPAPPGVLVLPVIAVRGVRVQALAILGLAEGSFPAVERVDPFLDEELRRDLGMDLRLDQVQAGLFYQAVTRADRCLLLTRPYLGKDGEAWEASPYWNAVQEVLKPGPARIRPEDARSLSEAASPEELLFWAARRHTQVGLELPDSLAEQYALRWQHVRSAGDILAARLRPQAGGEYDGDLAGLAADLRRRYGERAGWSASRLETYATCPFFFLAAYTLGLEVVEPPQLGYQANQLGSLLHEVLQQVYAQAPDPADTEEVLARLPEVAQRAFAEAPRRFEFRPSPLWEVQQDELLQALQRTVRSIADLDADSGWRPQDFEREFGLHGKPPLVIPLPDGEARLHGVVDRVDVNDQGQLRIIDYKSGGSHLAAQDLVDGRRLQLPLYALAASRALGLGEPAEGFYWKLFQAEPSQLKLSRFENEAGAGPQAAIALAVQHVGKIAGGIRQGVFEPRPPQGGCPSYCPAADWCWHYQPESR